MANKRGMLSSQKNLSIRRRPRVAVLGKMDSLSPVAPGMQRQRVPVSQ